MVFDRAFSKLMCLLLFIVGNETCRFLFKLDIVVISQHSARDRNFNRESIPHGVNLVQSHPQLLCQKGLDGSVLSMETLQETEHVLGSSAYDG